MKLDWMKQNVLAQISGTEAAYQRKSPDRIRDPAGASHPVS